MMKSIQIFFLSFLFFSTPLLAQDRIAEGTHSNREGGSYHSMTNWNTDVYEDYHLENSSGGFLINFRMLTPNGYDQANTAKQYPMIIMMHGAGESGVSRQGDGGFDYATTDPRYLNNDHQLLWGGTQHRDAVNRDPNHYRAFPGFVVFPQNKEGWSNNERLDVIDIIELLIEEKNIDPNRIYIHGLSAGAQDGVWRMVDMRPDLFAAMLPMSGTPANVNDYVYSKMIHIPLWLFQGEVDDYPTLTKATGAITNHAAAGGVSRFTVYENVGHATWNRAYAEEDFFAWMLGYSKLSIHVYHGQNEFCTPEEINAKLGISPAEGYNYEWSKNDVLIDNSNSHEIAATEAGYYKVRFERPVRGWTPWSDSVVVGLKEPTPIVEITADGTTVFPSEDGKESVTLTAPDGYEAYAWSTGETTQSININKLQTGSYRVKVTEPNGCPSAFSLPVVVVNNGVVMVAPGNLSATTVNESQINLFWSDNSSTEKGFEIYRSTTSGESYEYVGLTEPNEIFYADKNLVPSVTYYYVIRAVSNTGSSPITPEVSATTNEDTAGPSIPQNVVALGNIDLSSMTITWEASEDNVGVVGYIIYKVNPINGSLSEVGNTDETSFSVPDLIENNHYTFVVKAIDQKGNLSDPSNQASGTTTFCGVNFKLYKDGTWHYIDKMNENQIHARGNTGNFDISLINQYFPNDTDYFGFEFEGYIYITNPGNYTFYTRSDDGSMLWMDDSATPTVNNDGRHGAQNREGTLFLSAGRHKIRVKYFDATSGQTLEVSYKGPDTGDNKVLIPDEVLCSNPNFTPPAPLNVPADFRVTGVVGNQINLAWTDNNANESGFELYRKKSLSEPFALIHTINAGEATFEDSDLEANTTYYYKLRAIGTNSVSPFTDDDGILNYSYYEKTSNFSGVSELSTLTPVKTGRISNFNISIAEKNNYYGFIFEGNIIIETPGKYTFYTISDDGSTLNISNTQVVNNDGGHAARERSGTYTFESPGTYPISVRYYDNGGDIDVLEVSFAGPQMSRIVIPDVFLNSAVVKATTEGDIERPEVPDPWILIEKAVSQHSIGIAWEPATDNVRVMGYQIYDDGLPLANVDRKGNPIVEGDSDDETNSLSSNISISSDSGNGSMSLLSTEAEATVSTVIRGLESGRVYNLTVKAYDAEGNFSTASDELPVTTLEDQPLPVELVDFYAIAGEGLVELHWLTVSETNNDYFTVLRSLDGKDFKEIGEVDGAGNSSERIDYRFDDEFPSSGILYYQLKQTDTNGVYQYSSIININYNGEAAELDLSIYPNPVITPEVFLKLTSSNKESKVNVKIMDLLGRMHMNQIYEVQELLDTISISKARFSAGIYIISVQQADKIIKRKVIIE